MIRRPSLRACAPALLFALSACNGGAPDALNDAMLANEAARLDASANASVAEQIKALDEEAASFREPVANNAVETEAP